MSKLLFRWLVTSLAILIVPSLISGVRVDGLGPALAAAAILGILNVSVKPLLILLTLPLTFLTLGFFLLFINALLFQWVGAIVTGFHVASFTDAFLASLVVSFVSWILGMSVKRSGGGFEFKTYRRGEPPRPRETPTRPAKRTLESDETIELHPGDDGKWGPD